MRECPAAQRLSTQPAVRHIPSGGAKLPTVSKGAAPRPARSVLVLAALLLVASCSKSSPVAAPTSTTTRVATTPSPTPSTPAGSGLSSSEMLQTIAFVDPTHGFGLFLRFAGESCQDLVGHTDDGGAHLTLIALWNGQAGDGPGGTADMVDKARDRGAKTIILDTNTIFAS